MTWYGHKRKRESPRCRNLSHPGIINAIEKECGPEMAQAVFR